MSEHGRRSRQNQAIRQRARRQGMSVSDRGRIRRAFSMPASTRPRDSMGSLTGTSGKLPLSRPQKGRRFLPMSGAARHGQDRA
ncbi:hypothetical protein HBB16_09575 [Pseudonocardia sp. MCCB 268]|nr:hypothetical protein [Pseudonocardia cytotoxica]